jgi:hypothetical protein
MSRQQLQSVSRLAGFSTDITTLHDHDKLARAHKRWPRLRKKGMQFEDAALTMERSRLFPEGEKLSQPP